MTEIIVVSSDEVLRRLLSAALRAIGISAKGVDHQEAEAIFLKEKPKKIAIFDCNGGFGEGDYTMKVAESIFGKQIEAKKITKNEKRSLIEVISEIKIK